MPVGYVQVQWVDRGFYIVSMPSSFRIPTYVKLTEEGHIIRLLVEVSTATAKSWPMNRTRTLDTSLSLITKNANFVEFD